MCVDVAVDCVDGDSGTHADGGADGDRDTNHANGGVILRINDDVTASIDCRCPDIGIGAHIHDIDCDCGTDSDSADSAGDRDIVDSRRIDCAHINVPTGIQGRGIHIGIHITCNHIHRDCTADRGTTGAKAAGEYERIGGISRIYANIVASIDRRVSNIDIRVTGNHVIRHRTTDRCDAELGDNRDGVDPRGTVSR